MGFDVLIDIVGQFLDLRTLQMTGCALTNDGVTRSRRALPSSLELSCYGQSRTDLTLKHVYQLAGSNYLLMTWYDPFTQDGIAASARLSHLEILSQPVCSTKWTSVYRLPDLFASNSMRRSAGHGPH